MRQAGTNGGGGVRVATLRPGDRTPDELIDLPLEATFLHTCMYKPELALSSSITVDDFYSGANGIVFSAILRCIADGTPTDMVGVRAVLSDSRRLASIGGDQYLLDLTAGIPSIDAGHIHRLRKLSRLRRIRIAATFLAARVGTDEQARYVAELAAAQADLAALDGTRSPIAYRGTGDVFAALPETRWTVPGLHLGPGRPALWAGYGSSAKTLAAQALALAVASGTPAFGHFATEVGEVRHLDYEQGWSATARRYQRLALGHGIERHRLGERLRVATFPSVFLDSPNAVDAYARACDGAALVILDALRGATPASDENDSSIRVCLDHLTRVSELVGCAFLVIHHAGKPRDAHSADMRTVARGSSAIFDASGSVFVVSAAKNGDPRRVTNTKPPADAEGAALEDFGLVVEDVEIEGRKTAGVRVRWEPLAGANPVVEADAKWEADTARILDVIARNAGAAQSTIAGKSGINNARANAILRALRENDDPRVFVTARGKAFLYRVREGSV